MYVYQARAASYSIFHSVRSPSQYIFGIRVKIHLLFARSASYYNMAQSASNYIFDRAQFASRIILPGGNLCLFGNIKFCSAKSVFNYMYLLHFDANFRLTKYQVGGGWVRRLAKKKLRTHLFSPFQYLLIYGLFWLLFPLFF